MPLPSFDSRQGEQGAKRKQLIKRNGIMCRSFRRLMLYARDGVEAGQLDDMRQAGDLYEAASGRKNLQAGRLFENGEDTNH